MLMKWEDLEPGDTIQISKSAGERWGRGWLQNFINKELTIVEKLNVDGGFIIKFIYNSGNMFKNSHSNIFIEENGKWGGVQIFEVVRLKED